MYFAFLTSLVPTTAKHFSADEISQINGKDNSDYLQDRNLLTI